MQTSQSAPGEATASPRLGVARNGANTAGSQLSSSTARLLRECFVTNSSGCHRYGYWNEQSLFDGNAKTGWCTPSRKTPRVEFLEIDLGGVAEVGLIRLLSRKINPKAGFPGSLTVYVDRAGEWQEVTRIRTQSNDADLWHSYPVPQVASPRLRIEFDDVALRPEGKYFLQFMCLELYEAVGGWQS